MQPYGCTPREDDRGVMTETRTLTYAEAICEGLTESAVRDRQVLIMAEGVDDPSAVFGTTKGIAQRADPEQVIEIPVSENALVGVAIGAAMLGKRPVLSFHRPLRDYWRAFREAGFLVDDFEEPSITDRGRRELPSWTADQALRVPFSCIFRLVKPG